jgi:AraC-like DNA-binding protein
MSQNSQNDLIDAPLLDLAPLTGPNCRVVQVSALLRVGILRVMDYPSSYSENSPEARLVDVLLDEIQTAEIAPLHLPMPNDERAKKVALMFRADPSLRLTIADWAQSSGASERTLERIFHAETGMSFGKWQQQTRLLHALQILATGQSVTAAALEVGFKSPSAFIAMFRRTMGHTPSSYFADGY